MEVIDVVAACVVVVTFTVVATTGNVVDVVATVEVVVGGSVTFGVVVELFVVVVMGTIVVDFVVAFVVLVVLVVVVVVVGAGCKFKTISSFLIWFLQNFHFYNFVTRSSNPSRCSNVSSVRQSESNFLRNISFKLSSLNLSGNPSISSFQIASKMASCVLSMTIDNLSFSSNYQLYYYDKDKSMWKEILLGMLQFASLTTH